MSCRRRLCDVESVEHINAQGQVCVAALREVVFLHVREIESSLSTRLSTFGGGVSERGRRQLASSQ